MARVLRNSDEDSVMTELFLLRHGKTLANEEKRYCGKTDLPLSEQGREELLEKKERGAYPDISHCTIYTSGMKRTTQTLRLLYPELAKRFTEEKAFQEIDFGDFEMKSYEELKENSAYTDWVSKEVDRIHGDTQENPCPNGESWNKMNERVLVSLEKILKNDRSVAIFTHGGVISAIMAHFFPNEQKSLYEWQPDFCEGYKITIADRLLYEKIPSEGVEK